MPDPATAPPVYIIDPDDTTAAPIAIDGNPDSVQAALDKGYSLASGQPVPQGAAQQAPPGAATSMSVPPADTSSLQQELQHPYVAESVNQINDEATKQLDGAGDADINPDGSVKVVDPDGKIYNITADANSIAAAKDKGYQFYSDYNKEAAANNAAIAQRQQAQDAEDARIRTQGPLGYKADDVDTIQKLTNFIGIKLSPDKIRTTLEKYGYDSLEAAAAALDNNVFRDLYTAATHTDDSLYQQGLKDVTKKEHPYAYWGGAIAREAGTAFASGEIGESVSGALGLNAATKLGTAAKLATEGAVYAAPNMAVDILNHNYQNAGEDLAVGSLGNILTHGLFSVGGKAIDAMGASALDKAAAAAPDLETETNTIWKTLGATSKEIEDIKKYTPDLIANGTLKGGSGSVEKVVQENIDRLQALSDSGPKIGKAVQALDELPSASTLVQTALMKSREEIEKIANNYVGEQQKQIVRALTPIHKQIADVLQAGDPSFVDLQKLKQFVGGQTNFGKDNNMINNIKADVYDKIRNIQINSENEAASLLQKPEVSQALEESRAAYTVSKKLESLITRANAKDILQPFSMPGLQHRGLIGLGLHALGLSGPLSLAGSLVVKPVIEKFFGKGAQFNRAISALQDNAVSATSKAVDTQEAKINDGTKDLISYLEKNKATFGRAAMAAAVDTNHALNHFTPNNGTGLSNDQKLDKVRADVLSATTNPNMLIDHLATVTQPLRQAGLDQVAQAYTDHQLRLMKVIQAIIPKDPKMTQAHPFAAQVEPAEISPATKERYQRALTIAAQPEKLLDLVKSNSITPVDVAICGAVNPQTLQRMRSAMINEAIKSKPDLSYQQRLSIGILMGANVDQSTAPLPVIQDIYTPFTPTMGGQPNSKPHKGSSKEQADIADSYQTVSQQAIQNSP